MRVAVVVAAAVVEAAVQYTGTNMDTDDKNSYYYNTVGDNSEDAGPGSGGCGSIVTLVTMVMTARGNAVVAAAFSSLKR